jgi:hypothetical protein
MFWMPVSQAEGEDGEQLEHIGGAQLPSMLVSVLHSWTLCMTFKGVPLSPGLMKTYRIIPLSKITFYFQN